MKDTYLKTLLLFALLLLQTGASCQELPFKGGEKLSYVVHYKWGVNADLAGLDLSCTEETYNGVPCLHARGDAYTYRFWDSFYKIRDLYECRFTPDINMTPLMYHRDVNEGKYWSKNMFVWSKDASSIKVDITKSSKPPVDTTYSEGVPIRDMVNIIYYLRTLDLSATGSTRVVTCVADRDILDLKLRVIGKETISLKGIGDVEAYKLGVAISPRKQFSYFVHDGIQIKVQEQDGTFFGGEKIFIWYTADRNRMPVLFSAPLKVGAFRGRLESYKGNKYPLKTVSNVKAAE